MTAPLVPEEEASTNEAIQGVDYDVTFSPTTMLKFVRLLLAIDTHYNYQIW
jgi:hypothetical protein